MVVVVLLLTNGVAKLHHIVNATPREDIKNGLGYVGVGFKVKVTFERTMGEPFKLPVGLYHIMTAFQ